MQQPTNTKPHKKRVITEARKIQNREAQRAYRQRQKERQKAQKDSDHIQGLRPSHSYQQLRPYPPVEHRQDFDPDQTLFSGGSASWNLPIQAANGFDPHSCAYQNHVALSLSPSPCPSAISAVSLTDPLSIPGTGLVDGAGLSLSHTNPLLSRSDLDLFGRTEVDMEMELDPRIFPDLDAFAGLSNAPINPDPTVNIDPDPHLRLNPETQISNPLSNSTAYDEWLGQLPAAPPLPMSVPPTRGIDEQMMLSFAHNNEETVANAMYNHQTPAMMYPALSNSPALRSQDPKLNKDRPGL